VEITKEPSSHKGKGEQVSLARQLERRLLKKNLHVRAVTGGGHGPRYDPKRSGEKGEAAEEFLTSRQYWGISYSMREA